MYNLLQIIINKLYISISFAIISHISHCIGNSVPNIWFLQVWHTTWQVLYFHNISLSLSSTSPLGQCHFGSQVLAFQTSYCKHLIQPSTRLLPLLLDDAVAEAWFVLANVLGWVFCRFQYLHTLPVLSIIGQGKIDWTGSH